MTRKALVRKSLVRNERGSVIVMVAVSLAVILGMGALAVDMGMLIKQRDDAQRAADAAALAGVSVFQEGKPHDKISEASERAFEYVAKNYVGGTWIDTAGKNSYVNNGNRYVTEANEARVIVLPDSDKVRVVVRRPAVGVLFAKVLGFLDVPISAHAAAIAVDAGSGKCVKPFAFPDMWSDADNDTYANQLEDFGDKKTGENWVYDVAAGDHYRRFGDPQGSGLETGLGSSFRNSSIAEGDDSNTIYEDDYGRPIVLKHADPQEAASPGFFQPFVIPGTGTGGDAYRDNIASCNPAEIVLGETYQSEPGDMIGPTSQGMRDLINLDPDACWADSTDASGFTTGSIKKMSNGTCSADYPDAMSSPRVAIVPLFSPDQVQSGRTELQFNNLALIFIEEQTGKKFPVVGRFLFFVKGTGEPGPETGSLVKAIKLVE